jgi:hypothetical protein
MQLRWRHFVVILCVAALIVATRGATFAHSPRVPQWLSKTGLYDVDGRLDPQNLHYAPQYPLWTDGATKERWIYLPPGSKIDVSNLDVWKYPVGTKLWKQFSFAGHKVETRLIWHTAEDQWTFAAYRWNPEQTDAELVPEEGFRNAWEIQPGREHAIPGTNDCRTCHMGSPAIVLGFSALQLSDDRDPNALHGGPLPKDAVTLSTLEKRGRLRGAPADLLSNPPRIRTKDPIERTALGYLSANCGNCHNDAGPLARLGLFLLHDDAAPSGAEEPARATTIDAKGLWKVPGIPPDSSRIVAPGVPSHSSLHYRIASRRLASQMPPLGTVIRDSVAVRTIDEWIESLRVPSAATAPQPDSQASN